MSTGPGARGTRLPLTALLRDDTVVRIRRAVPADGAAVARMHRRCSLETVFRRYFTAVPQMSPVLQERLLGMHLTLVAEVGAEIVAMAHLAAAADQPTELAVLVEDSWQRRGLGRAMADAALDVASAEGLTEVVAYTLPSSVAVHTLLRRLRGGGLEPVFRRGSDGLVAVTLNLTADHAQSTARRLSA